MTSIRKSHISVSGYNTKERFDNLVAVVQKVKEMENERPRNVGLFVTPEKLSEFIYVRINESNDNSNRLPHLKKKQNNNGKEYFIGWKVLSRNNKRKEYKFELYVLHSQDFPITDVNYNPKFINSPDGGDKFLIPYEGIPVEEMLNRMLGISKDVLIDNSVMYKIY